MTYNSTSVSKVPEGTDNGNLTNDISKRAQITYYVEISHKLVVKHTRKVLSPNSLTQLLGTKVLITQLAIVCTP